MTPDRIILEFDRALRTVFGVGAAERASPAQDLDEPALDPTERHHAAALMRVNHCGEVCAQALYQGQALASDNDAIRRELGRAAREEADHLAWSAERIAQLGGRPSLLNPLWYAGSFCVGYAAGRLGDGWNLGFLAETERQVERHLEGHLGRLSPRDERTRAVIERMRDEEAGHGEKAKELGARELPAPVRRGMQLAARIMTTLAYRV
ncbi:MAG TPA: 2-polyprenyl-3-methyl-6-methoxy-1,4-benzoquinone monooxygenase [Burkholderiales bacterium]